MPEPKISLSGGNLTVSGYAPGWSIGDLGRCKLGDNFQIQRPAGLSDIQFGLSLHVLDCTWGQKGHLWVEQSLIAGGKYSFTNGTGSGSVQLNNSLLWTPMKELHFEFTFNLTGGLDKDGWKGTIDFGSKFKIIDDKAAFVGAGIRF